MDIEIQLTQEEIDRIMGLEVLIINGRKFIEYHKVQSMLVRFYEERNAQIEKVTTDLYEALDKVDDIHLPSSLSPIGLQEQVDTALVNYEKFKGTD